MAWFRIGDFLCFENYRVRNESPRYLRIFSGCKWTTEMLFRKCCLSPWWCCNWPWYSAWYLFGSFHLVLKVEIFLRLNLLWCQMFNIISPRLWMVRRFSFASCVSSGRRCVLDYLAPFAASFLDWRCAYCIIIDTAAYRQVSSGHPDSHICPELLSQLPLSHFDVSSWCTARVHFINLDWFCSSMSYTATYSSPLVGACCFSPFVPALEAPAACLTHCHGRFWKLLLGKLPHQTAWYPKLATN